MNGILLRIFQVFRFGEVGRVKNKEKWKWFVNEHELDLGICGFCSEPVGSDLTKSRVLFSPFHISISSFFGTLNTIFLIEWRNPDENPGYPIHWHLNSSIS